MKAALWTSAIAFAVMAGVYFTFSSFVMRSLGALPAAQGIASMQSINKVILSSGFMPLFWGTTLAALALAIWGTTQWGTPGAPLAVLGGLLYLIGMFGITAAFNVPLNEALDAVGPTTAEAAKLWENYLVDWTRWNHARTVASLGASGLLLAAVRLGLG